jgi:hypothetical protein
LQRSIWAVVYAPEEGNVMTHLKHSLAAIAAIGLIASASVAAQHEPVKGSTVMLTSCVERAQGGDGDKFVLTHVADVPTQPATHGKIVYWIEKVDKIKPHVGHQIKITGKITDVDKNEIEKKQGGAVVEIEAHGTEVKTSPDKAGVAHSNRDMPTTVVTLSIDKLEMVANKCLLATTK